MYLHHNGRALYKVPSLYLPAIQTRDEFSTRYDANFVVHIWTMVPLQHWPIVSQVKRKRRENVIKRNYLFSRRWHVCICADGRTGSVTQDQFRQSKWKLLEDQCPKLIEGILVTAVTSSSAVTVFVDIWVILFWNQTCLLNNIGLQFRLKFAAVVPVPLGGKPLSTSVYLSKCKGQNEHFHRTIMRHLWHYVAED